MRVTGQPKGRFLGYVQVQVGSRVYTLPVEASPSVGDGKPGQESGFLSADGDKLSILVDGNASDKEQRETIERASADAVRHLSRRLLN